MESKWIRRADLVLPGVSRLRGARLEGSTILSAWILLLVLLVARRGRVREWIVTGGGVQEWLAIGTLLGVLALCWWLGNRLPFRPDPEASASPWTEAARRFRAHRRAVVGLLLLAALGLVALLAPILAPHDPATIDLAFGRLLPPSGKHLMGTDELGRDVFSRVLYGARVSLSIGFLAVAVAITLGTAIGAVAGYAGGRIDAVLMRLVDLFLSFPRIVLLVAVVAIARPSIGLIVLILGLTGWMEVARLVRGQVLSVREREYVQAARALGFRSARVLGRHVLPNVLTPVIVAATLGIGNAILAEAALSYLGLGVQPPMASWGNIIQSGGVRMLQAWWITGFPGLAIVLTVMCINQVGDGLRDALDPRHLR